MEEPFKAEGRLRKRQELRMFENMRIFIPERDVVTEMQKLASIFTLCVIFLGRLNNERYSCI